MGGFLAHSWIFFTYCQFSRFRFLLPPDGQANRVFVSPHGGYSVYLNLSEEANEVGNDNRKRTIPPLSIYYAN